MPTMCNIISLRIFKAETLLVFNFAIPRNKVYNFFTFSFSLKKRWGGDWTQQVCLPLWLNSSSKPQLWQRRKGAKNNSNVIIKAKCHMLLNVLPHNHSQVLVKFQNVHTVNSPYFHFGFLPYFKLLQLQFLPISTTKNRNIRGQGA